MNNTEGEERHQEYQAVAEQAEQPVFRRCYINRVGKYKKQKEGSSLCKKIGEGIFSYRLKYGIPSKPHKP